ncbi:MAG: hypothetical protein IKG15_03820 [Solobacterium sp.]|nr:hypothetical protein [Solobacterium sp.]
MKKNIRLFTIFFLFITIFTPVKKIQAESLILENTAHISLAIQKEDFPAVVRSVPTNVDVYLNHRSGRSYDIIITYTGTSLIQSIKASKIKIANPSASGTVYYNKSFMKSGLSASQETVTIGSVTIPTGVSSVRIITTNLMVYYYTTGWTSVQEIYGIYYL